MMCLECRLVWEPLGGAGNQQIPGCPVCAVAAERDNLKELERDWALDHAEAVAGLVTARAEHKAERDALEAEVARLRVALEAIRDGKDWTAPDGSRARHPQLVADKALGVYR